MMHHKQLVTLTIILLPALINLLPFCDRFCTVFTRNFTSEIFEITYFKIRKVQRRYDQDI